MGLHEASRVHSSTGGLRTTFRICLRFGFQHFYSRIDRRLFLGSENTAFQAGFTKHCERV